MQFKRLSKTIWPSLGVCNFQLSWSESSQFQKMKKIKTGTVLQITKILPEVTPWCPRWPPERVFLYKYRPRAPGGLRLQQPGEEGNQILVGAHRASPGRLERAAACHAGREKGCADTWGAEAGAPGARAAGAGLPRCSAGRRAEAREHGRASGSPLHRRTGTNGRLGAAGLGRPEACKSDCPAGPPRRIRSFFPFLSFLLRLKQNVYLFLAVVGLRSCTRASLVEARGLLIAVASLVVEHGL